MAPAKCSKNTATRVSRRQAKASLQAAMRSVYVRGIRPEQLTLDNLCRGVQQQDDKWLMAADQLISRCSKDWQAPLLPTCMELLSDETQFAQDLCTYLLQTCTPAHASRKPNKVWLGCAKALGVVLLWGSCSKLPADDLLQVYRRCLKYHPAALPELTTCVLWYRTLRQTLLQDAAVLLQLLDHLEDCNPEDYPPDSRIPINFTIIILATYAAAEVTTHRPFFDKLQQLVEQNNPAASRLLSEMACTEGGQQLLAGQAVLLQAVVAASTDPDITIHRRVVWLAALFQLATGKHSSDALLVLPDAVPALVQGLSLLWSGHWSWVLRMCQHAPCRDLVLQHPQFLPTLVTSLQQLAWGDYPAAAQAVAALLEGAADREQLLQDLQPAQWLSSLQPYVAGPDAAAAWVKVVQLLWELPPGKTALLECPQLLINLFDSQPDLAPDCQPVLEQLRSDPEYLSSLLAGLASNDIFWVELATQEIQHSASAQRLLRSPEFPESLMGACRADVQHPRDSLPCFVFQLLQCAEGQQVLQQDLHLQQVVGGWLSQQNNDDFSEVLAELAGDTQTQLSTFLRGCSELLLGMVKGALAAQEHSSSAAATTRLAKQPWFMQMVEQQEELLDVLLHTLGPVTGSAHAPNFLPGIVGSDELHRSCQQAVLAQMDAAALLPVLLRKLGAGCRRMVQGAWNALDWLRLSSPEWHSKVTQALRDMMLAYNKAEQLPALQRDVEQAAIDLAQQHVLLRVGQQELEQLQQAGDTGAGRSSCGGPSGAAAAEGVPAAGGGRKGRRKQGEVQGVAGARDGSSSKRSSAVVAGGAQQQGQEQAARKQRRR